MQTILGNNITSRDANTKEEGASFDNKQQQQQQQQHWCLHKRCSTNGGVASYDRLRFVRLPPWMLPSSSSSDDDEKRGQQQLMSSYWPCLMYSSLAELIRDFDRMPRLLKAKLLIEHRKIKDTYAVACLLGWSDLRSSSSAGAGDDSNEKISLFIPQSSRIDDGGEMGDELISFLDFQVSRS